MRREIEASIAAAAQSEASFIESIRAIQTIKLFQRETERQSHWQNRLVDTMSLGMLFAFMSYKQHFVGAIDGLIDQLIAIQMLSVHLERIADIAFTDRDSLTQRAQTWALRSL